MWEGGACLARGQMPFLVLIYGCHDPSAQVSHSHYTPAIDSRTMPRARVMISEESQLFPPFFTPKSGGNDFNAITWKCGRWSKKSTHCRTWSKQEDFTHNGIEMGQNDTHMRGVCNSGLQQAINISITSYLQDLIRLKCTPIGINSRKIPRYMGFRHQYTSF